MRWTDALVDKILIVTDKNSDFFGHDGVMKKYVEDKPEYILFESYDPIFRGETLLHKDQFTILDLDNEIDKIDYEIEILEEKKKILKSFRK